MTTEGTQNSCNHAT